MTIHQTISQLSNQCVLCGVCIPHCPTYHIFRSENESPRGRIALFKALAEEQVKPDRELLLALDHCLGCRACEKNCPSQVDYAQISNLGRELIRKQYPLLKRPIKQKVIEKVLLTPGIHPLLKLVAKTLSPIQPLSKKQSKQDYIRYFSREIAADTAPAIVPKNSYPAEPTFSPHTKNTTQIILFKGCSSNLFEQQLLEACIRLLTACQIKVVFPEQQHCCGAISLRQGDNHAVRAYAQKNIKNFKPLLSNSQAIIAINNSCSAQLKEYRHLLNSAEADEFSRKSFDIIAFLSQAIKSSNIQFSPLTDKHVGVHIPCSLKNVLKEETLLFELLEHIPGIQLNKLNDDYCCGAAGSYMLQYPEVSNHLLDDKIDELARQTYSTLVSSNIGCSLHFKQGFEKEKARLGRKIEVIHPICLLARQLKP